MKLIVENEEYNLSVDKVNNLVKFIVWQPKYYIEIHVVLRLVKGYPAVESIRDTHPDEGGVIAFNLFLCIAHWLKKHEEEILKELN